MATLRELLRAAGKRELRPGGAHGAGLADAACDGGGLLFADELSWCDDPAALARLRQRLGDAPPGTPVVIHELLWRQKPPPALLAEMAELWGEPVWPRTTGQWWQILGEAGVRPLRVKVLALPWFRPRQLTRDEGDRATDYLLSAVGARARRGAFLRALDHFTDWDRFYGAVVLTGVHSGAQ